MALLHVFLPDRVLSKSFFLLKIPFPTGFPCIVLTIVLTILTMLSFSLLISHTCIVHFPKRSVFILLVSIMVWLIHHVFQASFLLIMEARKSNKTSKSLLPTKKKKKGKIFPKYHRILDLNSANQVDAFVQDLDFRLV